MWSAIRFTAAVLLPVRRERGILSYESEAVENGRADADIEFG
jgi:hypothetical protein